MSRFPRKPAFCIFLWPLYSDIIFFIDDNCAGGGGGDQISIAYCLFFIVFRFLTTLTIILSCVARKPVLGVSEHVRHKPGLTTTEDD